MKCVYFINKFCSGCIFEPMVCLTLSSLRTHFSFDESGENPCQVSSISTSCGMVGGTSQEVYSSTTSIYSDSFTMTSFQSSELKESFVMSTRINLLRTCQSSVEVLIFVLQQLHLSKSKSSVNIPLVGPLFDINYLAQIANHFSDPESWAFDVIRREDPLRWCRLKTPSQDHLGVLL
jgi:hypothetical protein